MKTSNEWSCLARNPVSSISQYKDQHSNHDSSDRRCGKTIRHSHNHCHKKYQNENKNHYYDNKQKKYI